MLCCHWISWNIVIDNLICNETNLEVLWAERGEKHVVGEISLCAQKVTEIWHMKTVQLRRIAKPTAV